MKNLLAIGLACCLPVGLAAEDIASENAEAAVGAGIANTHKLAKG